MERPRKKSNCAKLEGDVEILDRRVGGRKTKRKRPILGVYQSRSRTNVGISRRRIAAIFHLRCNTCRSWNEEVQAPYCSWRNAVRGQRNVQHGRWALSNQTFEDRWREHCENSNSDINYFLRTLRFLLRRCLTLVGML